MIQFHTSNSNHIRYLWAMRCKGQLISKGLVGILNSSKKRTKTFNLQYYDNSGRLVFVHFLEELKTSKSPLEINWPLVHAWKFEKFKWLVYTLIHNRIQNVKMISIIKWKRDSWFLIQIGGLVFKYQSFFSVHLYSYTMYELTNERLKKEIPQL